jgi:uncharacterized membrane protein
MSRIEKTITVEAPIDTVYGQWTQFESFPTFMDGVDKVVQVDDRTLDWSASVAGRTKTWQARIVDQTRPERIAWKSIDGAQNDGAVSFSSTGPGQTEIRLVVDADPDGLIEEVGDRLGFLDRRIGDDLGRFKEFIEGRSVPTGAWQGEIHGDDASVGVDIDPSLPTTASTTRADQSGRDADRGGLDS